MRVTIRKRIRYAVIAMAAAGVVAFGTAAYKADFKLGQSIELMVGMMRGIYLYYVDPVDPDDMAKRAAAGIAAGLDPYTELIHADDAEMFELATTGKYGGIGSMIRQRGEWVQVAEPYKGKPADVAGLEIGDTFLEIEGRSARGMTTADVSAALKGEPGTDVTIRVRKFYSGREQEFTIRREVIALPAVPYYGIVAGAAGEADSTAGKTTSAESEGGVGYIYLGEFTEGCADEFRAAFEDLRRQGAEALILDLRGNGGGIMQEAVKIIAMFVPKGTEAVSMRGRGEGVNRQYITETEPLDLTMPVAVLTDSASASASEIVAGAMQDLDRGVVAGQRTFGKGLVQSTVPLGFDSFLKITTAKYYIPSGRCIQAIDYSRRGETGGAGAVPDSLIQEFRTAGGRKVYDGGGVMPDVRMEPEYSSRFAIVAYSKGYIDDFVDVWELENREREVVPGAFALTDGDWAEFVEFMRDKDLDYVSRTGQTLDALSANAEYERLMNDRVKELIGQMKEALADDNEANVQLYRGELEALIEQGIVLRRHYARGVTEHSLADDPGVAEAVKVLGDKALYREILTTRDTERK